MPVAIDPDLVPDAWDVALIGNVATPGLCTVTKGSLKLKWDKKVAFGTDGPTTKLTGVDATTFTLTIKFWEGVYGQSAAMQRDWYEQQILPLLLEAKKGKSALAFYHPAVSEPPINCTAVVPEEISQYEQDDSGVWSVSIQFLRFGKPKPATGAPKAAKKDQPPALDENQKKIAELTAQLKQLASE